MMQGGSVLCQMVAHPCDTEIFQREIGTNGVKQAARRPSQACYKGSNLANRMNWGEKNQYIHNT